MSEKLCIDQYQGHFRTFFLRHFIAEDYLKQYELVGTLKIADRITEIWTYIPHVQGVRCILRKFAQEYEGLDFLGRLFFS